MEQPAKSRNKLNSIIPKKLSNAGFIFGHFFGGFLATTPQLDNVTDDHRHSRLLEDFPSVGGGFILTVSFSRKKGLLTFWEEGFLS